MRCPRAVASCRRLEATLLLEVSRSRASCAGFLCRRLLVSGNLDSVGSSSSGVASPSDGIMLSSGGWPRTGEAGAREDCIALARRDCAWASSSLRSLSQVFGSPSEGLSSSVRSPLPLGAVPSRAALLPLAISSSHPLAARVGVPARLSHFPQSLRWRTLPPGGARGVGRAECGLEPGDDRLLPPTGAVSLFPAQQAFLLPPPPLPMARRASAALDPSFPVLAWRIVLLCRRSDSHFLRIRDQPGGVSFLPPHRDPGLVLKTPPSPSPSGCPPGSPTLAPCGPGK